MQKVEKAVLFEVELEVQIIFEKKIVGKQNKYNCINYQSILCTECSK